MDTDQRELAISLMEQALSILDAADEGATPAACRLQLALDTAKQSLPNGACASARLALVKNA